MIQVSLAFSSITHKGDILLSLELLKIQNRYFSYIVVKLIPIM